ncbi:DUF3097 family protein [Rothia nasimurium]|uniref:DUF3097 family protein n=1 Tax=Rothia nasimurium TaxID=85336 RepID=UPI003B9EBE27
MDYRDSWGQTDLSAQGRPSLPRLIVKPGLVLEDLSSGFVGAVVQLGTLNGQRMVGLEDRHGRIKRFPLGPGFLFEGRPIDLVEPTQAKPKETQLVSRSGSIAVRTSQARTARASRIWVEGIHDAELIEKVWGHDLRVEGIVVEPMHGIDDLETALNNFGPAPHRKLGILVDHLVEGSKEFHLAQQVLSQPGINGNVLIVGHPFVDIWQAVKPGVLGLDTWPTIPRSEDWKTGILTRWGKPASTPEDIRAGWDQILGRVNTYTDLEPTLLGPVEQLIDFVTLEP